MNIPQLDAYFLGVVSFIFLVLVVLRWLYTLFEDNDL